MPKEIELMLKSYELLRKEILESITLQNRILTAAGTVIPILLGLGFVTSQEALKLLIVVVPILTIALIASWLVEQARIMRAGDYLQLLEDEINTKTNGSNVLWENWLRRETHSSWGKNSLQYFAQYIGVGIFFLIAIVSIGAIWAEPNHYGAPMLILWVCIVALVTLFVIFLKSVQHKGVDRHDYKEWGEKYLKDCKDCFRTRKPPKS